MAFTVPNKYRVRTGRLGSTDAAGNNGAFAVPGPGAKGLTGPRMSVIASDGAGWEHVSVSFPTRCPSWVEMNHVKALFWGDEDCVMQLHPARSEYVNNHPYCLHLWRPIGEDIPIPPSLLVGFKSGGVLTMDEARALRLADVAEVLLAAGVRDA